MQNNNFASRRVRFWNVDPYSQGRI